MEPITRKEMYLATICGDYSGTVPEPVTRMDYYMAYAAGAYGGVLPQPIRQQEFYWAYICGATDIELPEPVTRIDMYLAAICGGMILLPEPITREEIYLAKIAKQSEAVVKSAAGKTIVLTDSLEAPFEDFHIYGHTTQETTTGAQLLDIPAKIQMDSERYTINADGTINMISNDGRTMSDVPTTQILPAGTYTASIEDCSFQIYDKTNQDSIFTITGMAKTFTINEDTEISWKVHISGNEVWNAKPMLNAGSTALPWEPYTGGQPSPNPEYPQELVSAGDKGSVEVDVQGAQLLNGNEVVRYTGTNIHILYENGITIQPGIYTFYPIDTNGVSNVNVRLLSDTSYVIATGSNSVTFTIDEITTVCMNVNYVETLPEDISNYKFQLNVGSTALPWEPYRTPQTLTLSTPNGLPGIPVTSGGNYTDESGQQWVCDEVDFGRGVYVQRCKYVDLKQISWKVANRKDGATKYFFSSVISGEDIPLCESSNIYGTMSNIARCNNPYSNIGDFAWAYKTSDTNGYLCLGLLDTDIDTVDKLTTYLQELDVAYAAYALLSPIETPLSADDLAAYQALHTNYPTTTITNDEDCWMEVGYKAKPISQYSESMTLEYLKGE